MSLGLVLYGWFLGIVGMVEGEVTIGCSFGISIIFKIFGSVEAILWGGSKDGGFSIPAGLSTLAS